MVFIPDHPRPQQLQDPDARPHSQDGDDDQVLHEREGGAGVRAGLASRLAARPAPPI